MDVKMKPVHFYLIIVGLLLVVYCNSTNVYVEVDTDKGAIRGRRQDIKGKDCYRFLGVPYAEPPVNSLRFRRPMHVKKAWDKPRDALDFGPSCPQAQLSPIYNRLSSNSSGGRESEDCLYLNIYTPDIQKSSKLAVLVWIHGGSCLLGTGAWWHGELLSTQENIVIVTINYRLGALGYLSGLDGRGKPIMPANIGHLDQKAALEWVKRNIHNFGGDKERVTIAGNSAGAMGVSMHIVAPGSRGLFRNAILQSGSSLIPGTYHPNFDEVNQIYSDFLFDTNCNKSLLPSSQVACLREIPLDKIIQAQWNAIRKRGAAFKPIIDKKVFNEDVKKLVDQTKFNPVTIMFGITKNDGSLWTVSLPNIDSGIKRDQYVKIVENRFTLLPRPIQSAIIHRYTKYSNIDDPQINHQTLQHLWTDFAFLAPLCYFADRLAANGSSTYMYVFDKLTANSHYYPKVAGVAHQMEVPYVFGYPMQKPSYFKDKFDEQDVAVSQEMMQLWGSFIRDSKPQGPLEWPKYEPNAKYFYNISLTSNVGQFYRVDDITFWNEVVPKMSSEIDSLMLQWNKEAKKQRHISDDVYKISTFALLGFLAVWAFYRSAAPAKSRRQEDDDE